jgi:hypothetical protein
MRALAVVHRPGTRAARLDALELELLVRLPSALSIADPADRCVHRIRAIDRKLGVSCRRTAVSVAHALISR